MMTFKTTAIALLATISLSGIAMADQHGKKEGGRHHPGMMQMGDRMAEKLQLTEQQREEMRAIHEEYGPRMKELMQSTRETRKALHEAKGSGASQSDIDALAKAQGEHQAEMISLRYEIHERMQAVLTEEQRAQMEEMKENRQEKMKERRGKHHDRDQPEDE
ncbi:Spy/CpxP family protein refolding chaperone [Porticoccaceae bacterium LTM1]|nr:Spy/CpxP family protein refolding chaperone [Porticoccaceae bacterium LTM1]